MNPFSWFRLVNDEKHELDFFDPSLVIPLTVGLGTVVISVLLGYRNTFLSIPKNTVPLKSPLSSDDSVVRKPVKYSTKPKYISSHVAEIKLSDQSPAHSGEHHAALSPSESNPVLLHSPNSTAVNNVGLVMELSVPVSVAVSSCPASSLPIKRVSADRKKPKKSKRPLQHKLSNPASLNANNEDSIYADPTWITVTSKKSKTTATSSTVASLHSKDPDSILSLKSELASIHSAPSGQQMTEISDVPSAHPMASFDKLSLPSSKDVGCSQQVVGSPVSFKLVHSNVAKSPSSQPTISKTSTGHTEVESVGDQTDTAPQNVVHDSLTSNASKFPCQTDKNAECSVSAVKRVSETVSATSIHLPSTNQLLAVHISGMLQAKEAECQALRSEVIRLREDLNNALLSTTIACAEPTCIDAETMTVIQMTETEVKPKQVASPEPSKSVVSPSSRAFSPDSVLLKTLKDEIARLAKEVTLSHQRNDNLESRLATTKAQALDAKKVTAKELKSIRQQLTTESRRADQAESSARDLETKLQEVLQQNEIQRRKIEDRDHSSNQQLEQLRFEYAELWKQKEQWERDLFALRTEKDHLVKELDDLRERYQINVSDVDRVQRESETFRSVLLETQTQLQAVERDRSAALSESQTRVQQLEAQLVSEQQRAAADQCKLERLMIDLKSETDGLRMRLSEGERDLSASQSQCALLENTINEERTHRQQSAEAIQTCSETDPTPVTAHIRASFDVPTQTDFEPSTEFESPVTEEFIKLELTSPTPVLSATQVELGDAPDVSTKYLEAQIVQYKCALDVTETMLSKLQSSVNEEEDRWRNALNASKMECELLESKITKLEASLTDTIGERDQLKTTVHCLERLYNPQDSDVQSVNGASSVRSLSVSSLIDTVSYDENTPKADLIKLLNRFRHMVHIEHEALKVEQDKVISLQSKLNESSLTTLSEYIPSPMWVKVPHKSPFDSLTDLASLGEAKTLVNSPPTLSPTSTQSEAPLKLEEDTIPEESVMETVLNGVHSLNCHLNGDA